jgi:hypothetical protein
MPIAPPIHPNHQVNRLIAAMDMAARLVAEHTSVEAALSAACTLRPAGWLALGRRAGHYAGANATVADETISAVLAHLEAMTTPAVDSDPFAGIGGF